MFFYYEDFKHLVLYLSVTILSFQSHYFCYTESKGEFSEGTRFIVLFLIDSALLYFAITKFRYFHWFKNSRIVN